MHKEFKVEAVELAVSSVRPVAQLAPEIAVNEGTVANWVRLWRDEHPDAQEDHGAVEWAKFKALQAEHADLKREIEFLARVSAFFAVEQR